MFRCRNNDLDPRKLDSYPDSAKLSHGGVKKEGEATGIRSEDPRFRVLKP